MGKNNWRPHEFLKACWVSPKGNIGIVKDDVLGEYQLVESNSNGKKVKVIYSNKSHVAVLSYTRDYMRAH